MLFNSKKTPAVMSNGINVLRNLRQWFSKFFFSWHTHQLITNILWHPKNIFFANLTHKKGVSLTHWRWMAVVVLAVVQFLFDSLRGKRSGPRLNSQVLHVIKILVAHQLNTTGIRYSELFPCSVLGLYKNWSWLKRRKILKIKNRCHVKASGH